MRRDVEFRAEDGTMLRGWHYLPDRLQTKAPTIVMAHGFSATKEFYLDEFAEAFASAGLASLVFDNRNFGASEGKLRQEIDPWQQVSDYRDAITFTEALEHTDPERMGIWGSSYSGGHVLVLGAIDRRVKCIVSQVSLISGYRNFRRLVRSDSIAALQRMFEADRRANEGRSARYDPGRCRGPGWAGRFAQLRLLDVFYRNGPLPCTHLEE